LAGVDDEKIPSSEIDGMTRTNHVVCTESIQRDLEIGHCDVIWISVTPFSSDHAQNSTKQYKTMTCDVIPTAKTMKCDFSRYLIGRPRKRQYF
jgi:hypothetical protein